MLKICKYCCKEFVPKRKEQVFCGRYCHIEALRKCSTRVCVNYGKEFDTTMRGKSTRRCCSPECARAMMSGKNCHLWRGGITEANQVIRTSFEFKQWSREVKERDDFRCKICNRKGGRLHSHHTLCFALYEEHRFDVDNGVALCVSCHHVLEHGLRRGDVLCIKLNRLLGWRIFSKIKSLSCP